MRGLRGTAYTAFRLPLSKALYDEYMKVLLFSVCLVVIIIVAVPLSCHYIEQPSRYYENYTKELHEGLWVPDIFPADIKYIYEQHDIDSYRVWLRFNLGLNKINLSRFSPMNKPDVPVRKPFLTTWWFSELPEGYIFYKGPYTKYGSSVLAISSDDKPVYWWRD